MAKKEKKAEVLVVTSKIKAYVKENSEGFRTSGDVAEALTDIIKSILDNAIANCDAERVVTVKASHIRASSASNAE